MRSTLLITVFISIIFIACSSQEKKADQSPAPVAKQAEAVDATIPTPTTDNTTDKLPEPPPPVVMEEPKVEGTQGSDPAIINRAEVKFLDEVLNNIRNYATRGNQKKLSASEKAEIEASKKRASDSIDFMFIGKKSLIKHWQKISAAERKEFIDTLRALVEEIAYPKAREYDGNAVQVAYIDVITEKDKSVIKTAFKYKNKEVFIDFWIHKPEGSSSWLISDLIIEGESWIDNFRSQFNNIIQKKSFKELLKMMKKKVASAKKENKAKAK